MCAPDGAAARRAELRHAKVTPQPRDLLKERVLRKVASPRLAAARRLSRRRGSVMVAAVARVEAERAAVVVVVVVVVGWRWR